ncbi:mitochondrial half-size ABC transporter [Mycena alexandri]|uniref:Mitochondrial half-size ABC transporter n=1 Tax=Mycena alexandri TaxID=1745969 RepID=A0AAD6T4T8_9AGAR|nr:mitochondrial half-size ABC transporter [Mycena alexandri]
MVGSMLALFALRVLSPALVCLSTLSLIPATPPPPPPPSAITRVVVPTVIPRRALILSLLSLVALTFLLDGLIFVVYAVIDKTWPHNTGIEYNALLGLIGFAGLAALGAWEDIRGVNVWIMKRVQFAIATASAIDLVLVVLIAKAVRFKGSSLPIPIIFPALRVLAGSVLVAALASPRIVYKAIPQDENEESSATDASFLLPPPSTGLSPVSALPADSTKYGTFRTPRSGLAQSTPATRVPSPSPPEGTDVKSGQKPDIALDPSWGEIWRRISRIVPYLWPSKSRPLQLLVLLCIILILLGRVVNAGIPFALGEIIRIFETGSDRSIWPILLLYVMLRFLQGSGGLAALRDCLWTPVMQYSDREMSSLAFDHLLQLSLSFHTHRNTGAVLRVLDRGAAINHTLENILFTIVPTFIDIAVALVVFCVKFEWTLALVVFIVMFAYVAASIIITRWRTKIRRQMNERDVITRGIHADCLLNYETVKYFGGEDHEGARYREAVAQYQELEHKVIFSLNFLNLIQNFIISVGLLVGSMIVALRVTKGQSAPSDFVIFITYLAQLYGPLNQLGSMYRAINQSLVDTEKLLQLLNEPTEVNDRDDATALVVDAGEIEFDNVSFSYDKRTTAISGVSFKVPKGSSVALVGESGAGKSTILRLLYRFYDLPEGGGRILIDGQDIRNVTQKSLRAAIGVVPQDSVLFNSSIAYNIGYGKFGSSPEEIEEAAKSAQMHDRIVAFPDGYNTKVGERGVRLSGGEKQRVAIARTLLKNPPILLLDEATSALDTSTEKDIQKALQNLVRGRSSLSIAHRLSTIASADVILVLKDGQIAEQGTHTELLALDGIFASMWADQISTSGGLATPVADTKNLLPEAEIAGYSVEPELPAEAGETTAEDGEAVAEDEAAAEEGDMAGALAGITPEEPTFESAEPVMSPVSEEPPVQVDDPSPSIPAVLESAAPIAFPVSEPEVPSAVTTTSPEPVTFPVSDDAINTANTEPAAPATPTGVTFEPGLSSPTSSPDPDAEPKRKRISSQNFQRLARKISLSTRRQGSTSSSISSMIPGLKRDKSGDDNSIRGGEGSGRDSIDSPTTSLVGDKAKGKKKDKKDKRKSTN